MEEPIFLGAGIPQVSQGYFPALMTVMVRHFVAENPKQPGAFGRASRETLTGPEGGQKGLLDQLLGYSPIANANHRETEEHIAVVLQPPLRI
jgi:hypothetical protein